ncbi:MAG TPA: SCO1664 family protein [Mycobacteriales bacterium]|jgi:uncharacterized repeat protein (TIGR03843 family)|nr:SCO1664 family protein [Mycobacteriales bacterium]
MSPGDRSQAQTERTLSTGTLELRAQIQTGNNAVFVADVVPEGGGDTPAEPSLRCVYKPITGERPLWDFPGRRLAPREVAAYLVDRAAGWDHVPPTVLREGPLGPGSCQLWIPHLEEPQSLFDVFAVDDVPAGWKVVATGLAADEEEEPQREVAVAHPDDKRLARIAVLDAVLNNSDRKAGHLLPEGDRLRAIDHGVSFHSDPKLRTVLWGWAGDPLPDELIAALRRIDTALAGELTEELGQYLDDEEIAAVRGRIEVLLRLRAFPLPASGWPALPYPLF